MAEEPDKFIWLLTQETIGHHESAKKCQQLIQELMWERGRIELAYIQSLEKWAETLSHGIQSENSPYIRHIQEVLILPAREAQAQASQHQLLYNDILRADGPCLRLRKLIQSIEESTMVSESNRVYSTAVSQYQALVQRRQELEGEVRRKKQHYDYSLSASRDMDEKVEGRRRRKTTRPLSARKMETMESRRYHLKKYSEVQLTQLREQETELESFMKNQRKPLESIQSDLNLFLRRRLSDTVGLTKAYLHTLAQHEAPDNREKKQEALLHCENVLERRSVTSLADNTITSLKEKVKQMIIAQNAVRFSLEDMVCSSDNGKQFLLSSGGGGQGRGGHRIRPTAPGPDTFRFRPSGPSPDCPQNRHGMSEGGFPIPPQVQYGHSQIARVSHLLQVQSLQDELYMSCAGRNQEADVVPSASTGTMHVFYTSSSSNDSMVAKAGSEQPTASNSVGSEVSVETLIIPPERKTIPRDQLPFEVKDFCIDDEEEDEDGESFPTSDNLFASVKRDICKRILKREYGDSAEITEVIELTPGQLLRELTVEEETSIACAVDSVQSHTSILSLSGLQTTPSASSSVTVSNDGNDITTMANIRVRALHAYQARNMRELNLEKGQIIKQKAGADESGFSYGWTRAHKMGQKRYGFYPSDMVEPVCNYRERSRQSDTGDMKKVKREHRSIPLLF